MANTVINTPELLNLDSTTGATVLAKGTINERPSTPTFSVDYLVVAGGGGGGGGVTSESPGAGGAGAVIYQAAGLNVIPSSEYTLYIAAGGAGGGNNTQGTNGQDSYISFGGSNVVLAKGGGGGGSNAGPGKNGGSGGGGTRDGDANSSQAGGSAVATNIAPAGASIYGNNGATGTGTSGCSGGGGGAGSAGAVLTGGDGIQINIDGNNYYWGGGGGACGSAGTGGQGGGGGGPRGGQGGTGGINPGASTGATDDNGGNGGANTGGGGGGATNPTGYPGGTGGSGIIILRYPNTFTLTVGSGSLTTGQLNTAVGTDEKYTSFTGGTGTISFSGTVVGGDNDATDGALRFNTDTNKTEYFDGANWYEIVDEYASGFVGPATNYFDTKLYPGNNATQIIGGHINGAASFNGSSSIIKDVLSGFTYDNKNMTFSAWIKSSKTTVGNNVIIGQAISNADGGWGIDTGYAAAQKLSFSIANPGVQSVVGSITMNTGNWQHVAVIVDFADIGNGGTSAVKMYVNGVEDTNLTGNLTQNFDEASYNTSIGGTYTGSDARFFDGQIDQVRVYNAALSSSDITALYTNETAATATTAAFPPGQTAIATYTMDTNANGLLNTQDLSTVDYPTGTGCMALYEMNGNSNDTSGTYNGTPTNITYEQGAFDQAAVFNGSSSKITFTNSAFNITTYSLSFWIYSSSYNQSQASIINMGLDNTGGAWSGLAYGVDSNKVFYYGGDVTGVGGTGIFTQTGTTNLTNGAWTHIAIVVNGTAITGYIDGTQDSGLSRTLGANITYRAGSINTIGVRQGAFGSYGWYNGSVDQFRVFNTALSSSDITTLARGIATSYSGASTNVNFNGHLDFQPDFVWIKSRTANAYPNNVLQDSVRGPNQYVISDLTNAQATNATFGSFDPNGFTLTTNNVTWNGSGSDYVSWNWKAGGTAVTNNNGTIPTQVSANKDSGFSIATYTGVGYPNASTAEVGHGLIQAPELVFVKGTGGTGQSGGAGSWVAGTGALASNNWAGSMYLNSTGAYYTTVNYFWNGAATDSVVKLKTDWFVNGVNNTYVMYSWHSVAGYSKISSYAGTGLAGNSIVTGFQPNFLMVKRTDSTSNWRLYNSAMGTGLELYANSSAAEAAATGYLNFNSTGFEINTTGGWLNGAGGTYLYMAIA